MGISKITIEKEDWLKYLKDNVEHSLKILRQIQRESTEPEPNQYLEGQMATMRHIDLMMGQLIEDGWNKENVINNFYTLKMNDNKFEKKYKEIWSK